MYPLLLPGLTPGPASHGSTLVGFSLHFGHGIVLGCLLKILTMAPCQEQHRLPMLWIWGPGLTVTVSNNDTRGDGFGKKWGKIQKTGSNQAGGTGCVPPNTDNPIPTQDTVTSGPTSLPITYGYDNHPGYCCTAKFYPGTLLILPTTSSLFKLLVKKGRKKDELGLGCSSNDGALT